MKQPKRAKTRNPMARQLRAPAFRKRTVRSRKIYTRKGRASDDRADRNTPRCARPPGLRAARGKPRLSAALRGGG